MGEKTIPCTGPVYNLFCGNVTGGNYLFLCLHIFCWFALIYEVRFAPGLLEERCQMLLRLFFKRRDLTLSVLILCLQLIYFLLE